MTKKLPAAIILVPLASACASINSSSYVNNRVPDGILYKLPEKVYTATVTYSLESCPGNGDATPVEMSPQDLTITSALAPSTKEVDWYFINPAALNSVFSSIDPATIELNQGMLTKVGLKSKGALTDVIKLAATVGRAVVLGDRVSDPARCTNEARAALKTKSDLDNEIARLKKAIQAVEQSATAALSEDQARLLERLDGQLGAVQARKSKHVDEALKKKLTFLYRPSLVGNPVLRKPVPADFSSWFGGTVNEEWVARKVKIDFNVHPPMNASSVAETPAVSPSPGFGYNGIYYRRPAVVDISASYASEWITTMHVLRNERVPQLGTLARVAVEGTILGSRGVALEFDADGDLKKYEMSSSGLLADAETASGALLTAAEGEPDKAELEKLTAEVDLLKKKKERIDAQAALDAATAAPQ